MKAKLAWGLVVSVLAASFAAWLLLGDELLAAAGRWASLHREFVRSHAVASWLGLLAVGAVAINSPLPLAALFKVLAGYLFGLAGAFVLNVAMSVLGGLAGFAAARHLFHRALRSRFGRSLARADLDIARNGFWYVLSARFLMVTPFFLVNVLAGLSCIRKRKFLLGTLLGVIPSSFIYAESGSQLASLTSLSGLASPRLAVVLGLLAALSILPVLARRKKAQGT